MNQDNQQRSNVLLQFVLEMYSLLISTCLIMYVPQMCENKVCGLLENVFVGKTLYDIAFIMNLITLVSFLGLYIIELDRETKLINYLEVNHKKPTDNESVGIIVEKLDPHRKKSILKIDRLYMYGGYYCLICFTTNTIFSGYVLFYDSPSADSKTATGFITNILFLTTKLYHIYYVATTEKNIFYSAYLRNFVQYNDLEPEEDNGLDLTDLYIHDSARY